MTSPAPQLALYLDSVEGQTVTLTGLVSGTLDPSHCTVTVTGAASGTVTPNLDGSFTLITTTSQLGAIDAVATDWWGQTSNTAEVDLTSPAPSLTLTVAPNGGQTVTVSGQVTDPMAGQCDVSLSGVVSGNVWTNPDGTFSLTTTASGPGTIAASVSDPWNQTASATTTLSYAMPSLTLNVIGNADQTVTVFGQVSDTDPGDCTVTFSGVVSGSTTTNPDGTFSYTTTPSGQGTIQAIATDDQTQTSNPAQVELSDAGPTLTLNVTPNGGQTVTVSGQVSDEAAAECSVFFSGVISGLVYTNPDGSFSYTTTASGLGAIDAVATDASNLTSAPVEADLTDSTPTMTLNVTPDSGQSVTVWGQVSDQDPGATLVSFSGVIVGSVATNTDGSFSYTTTASALGTITATASDQWGLTTAQAQTQLSADAPSISFSIADVEGQNVTLFGLVVADQPANLGVQISGVASAGSETDATGEFQTTVQASQLGAIDASVTDVWGQTASSSVELTSAAPSLTLTVTPNGVQTVTVSGQVTAPDAGQCSVAFFGVISGSVTTNPDGSFSYTTTASGSGEIDAVATDIWGQTSTTATTNATVLGPSLTLQATPNGGQTVTVSGQVNCVNPGSVQVFFSGLLSGSVWTNPDGRFSLTTTVSGGGAIDAQAQDSAGNLLTTASVDLSDATPSLTLNVIENADQTVTVFGQVSDPDPGNCTVNLTGVVTGSTTTNPDGTFSYTAMPSGQGTIQAIATDDQTQTSNPAQVELSDAGPTLTLNVTPQGGQMVTVSGQVNDEDPGQCSVTFSGVISGWVNTNPDGSFSFTTPASALGNIQAVATDVRDMTSEPVAVELTDSSPSLTLNVTVAGGRTVTVSGQVSDEEPGECEVTFSGVISGSVNANADGSFRYTTTASALGTITAYAVNNWGVYSEEAQTQLSVSPPTMTLNLQMGQAREITLSGTVTGPDPTSDTVEFYGAAAGWVTPQADGSFSLMTEGLQAGTIQAVVRDAWSQVSEMVTVTINNKPPAIQNFGSSLLQPTLWNFQGKVTDDQDPLGLRVYFNGLPAVQNQSVLLTSWDSCFNVNLTIPQNQQGTVAVDVDDWWGAAAEEVFAFI